VEQLDIYQTRDTYQIYRHIPTQQVIGNNLQNPFFTIIIPTYLRPDTLAASIQSAIDQVDFTDYEILIISNDPNGAEGKTREIIDSFFSEKIAYYVNTENIGMSGNWNRAVELAKGKYIVMLHDDDLLGPYCVATMFKAIQEYGQPGMVGCGAVNFSNALPAFEKPEQLRCRRVTKKSFFFGRYLQIAGMTFRKDLALALGGFDENCYPAADTVFIYQCLLHGQVINIDNNLVGYRKGVNESLSGNTMKNIILKTEQIRRSIAKHEFFAKIFMKLFGAAYLDRYILDAKLYWSMDIDRGEIFQAAGLKQTPTNKLQQKLLSVILRLERRFSNSSEKL